MCHSTIPVQVLRSSVLAFSLLLSSIGPARADTIIDTGPGTGPAEFGWFLEDLRPEGSFQHLAAGFALEVPTRITSISAWIFWRGGPAHFSIYSNDGRSPGVALVTTTVNLHHTGDVANWCTVDGLDWLLPAGNYWVVLRDVRQHQGTGLVPDGAPRPLSHYVFKNNEWGYWRKWPLDFGLIVLGTPVP